MKRLNFGKHGKRQPIQKDATFNIRMTSEFKEQMLMKADEHGINLSKLTRKLLKDYLKF